MGLTFGGFFIWVIYLPLFIQNNSSKQARETKDREIFRNSSEGLVVEEGCFTPFLCGGIPLTFGGIN